MRSSSRRIRLMFAATIGLVMALCAAVLPTAANATPSTKLAGMTTVTTAPGIATTLIGAGILPLPIVPGTTFGVGLNGGLNVSYGFAVTGGAPSLSPVGGDITHTGGIIFLGWKGNLTIADFTIDLNAGKVYATKVNGKAAKVAVLDIDLGPATVAKDKGVTTISGVPAKLDPEAAGAINATFGTALPADGSLLFGTAKVVLK